MGGPPRLRSPYSIPVGGITPKVEPIEPASVALAIVARLVVPIVVAETQSLKFPISVAPNDNDHPEERTITFAT